MKKHIFESWAIGVGLLLATWVAASPAYSATGAETSSNKAADVDDKRLLNAAKDGANWLSYGRTYDEQRYSPLTAINDKNVARLGLQWSADLDTALAQWLTHVGFPFEADDAASFWSACEAMYARSLRFMLEDPRNAALCLSITQARERLENHPVLTMLNERMMEWTGALVRQGQALGAVRADVPSDLLVHAGLALMDAGDRWLASRWSEIDDDAVEGTAKTMVDLFKRVGQPEGAR